MTCKRCGSETPQNALYCPFCGKRVNYTPKAKKRGNGQGTVIKRGNSYTVIISVASHVEDGKLKRTRKSKGGFATKKEALAYIPTLKEQLFGNADKLKDITLSELYALWKEQHSNDVSKSTMGCYQAAWNYYEDIKHYKVNIIKTATLQNCLDNCGKGKRTQENMKALGTMLFRMAMQNDIVDKNYAEGLKARGDKQEPRQPFTNEELLRMFNIVNSPQYDYLTNHIDLVLILCYTGFRLDELLNLKCEDYHEEKDWSYFVGGLKTEAGRNRIVGISPKILPLVKRHLKDGYIFSKNGGKFSTKDFREKVYYPALEENGFEKKVPHCCRHTFATLMKNVGGSDKDKMELIGHASISQTMEYTHADLDGLRKITDSL